MIFQPNAAPRRLLLIWMRARLLFFGGAVTYAALVLFGKSEALGRLLSQCEVVFEYRSTEATGPAQQRVDFRRGFFSFFDELWNLVNLRNDLQHYQSGLFVEDVPTFDERAVREAVMNAICHRDYQLGGSVFITQYPRKLVITSPGGFLPGITPENVLYRRSSRNRLIAELLHRCGLVERVQLALSGLVRDPALLVMMERIGKEMLQTFNTEDFLLVDRIYGEEGIPEELRPRIPRLVELGVIEKTGKSRYLLSRRFYAETGSKGVYTRKKGLDREENKALLLKHIRGCAAEGAPLADLCDVLTERSARQIQSLLKELQKQGVITVIGKTRAGRWYPVSQERAE